MVCQKKNEGDPKGRKGTYIIFLSDEDKHILHATILSIIKNMHNDNPALSNTFRAERKCIAASLQMQIKKPLMLVSRQCQILFLLM